MVSSDTGGGLSDCSVGSIVWVRRRNGSWWPGKILGPEELSSVVVTSPRSGTPVKLLGREDASVDWYNLEKSKRVKAFRCGEFDDCIERAEVTQGMPPKKREKYARREDAILHALVLERQLLEKKHGNLGSSSNGVAKLSPEAVTSSEYLESGGGNHKDLRPDELPERLGSSLAKKNVADQHLRDETLREGNQLSGDDDSTGMLPRMRGLQDFGLRTTPPVREELSGGTFRTKRSRYAYLPYGSGEYSNDNQIISSQMGIPVSRFEGRGYPVDIGEDHNSGSTDDTETDCSETDSLESDSDDETNGLSDGSASIELLPKYPRRIGTQEELGSISSNDDLDELGGFSESIIAGGSKWHLKRKRNNRSFGKRSVDKIDEVNSRACVIGRNSNWSNTGFKADFVDSRPWTHMSRYPSTSLRNANEKVDFEGVDWNNHPANRVCWEDLLGYYMYPFHDGRHRVVGRTMLIDVELKVDANNYCRDVPMISMVSKLNGHAIVGHPIQVEALESGSSENLVSATDYFYPEHTHLPAVWRTGRRTANARVPRPFLSSSLNRDTKSQAHIVNQDRLNPSQKISPSSSQKIRKLSNIASEHNNQNCGCRNYQVDVQVKNGKAPKTACIPVNFVFRRLHDELIGHHQ